jgi:hypothetical protein
MTPGLFPCPRGAQKLSAAGVIRACQGGLFAATGMRRTGSSIDGLARLVIPCSGERLSPYAPEKRAWLSVQCPRILGGLEHVGTAAPHCRARSPSRPIQTTMKR